MTIQKNVASQKLHFLMVDATDFATPETGMTVSAYYFKDGGARSTCSNSVSEITSGLYVITLAATETDADVATYQFTASGAADQYITHYPESGYKSQLSSIEADVAAILTDTGTTLENRQTSVLNAVNSILTDTGTTLDNKIDSILVDTGTTIISTLDGPMTVLLQSIVDDTSQILLDTAEISNLAGAVDTSGVTSALALLKHADYGLNAIETISSDILEALDSAVAGPITSILTDTSSTLENRLIAVEADTTALGKQITLTGTAAVTDTTVKITLTGGVATDNYYNGQLVVITGGTGVGQARTIGSYTGADTIAVPTRDFAIAPDNTSTFVVVAADVAGLLEAGVATAGAASTITFDATASTTVDIYKNNFVAITGGTGAGQTRLIGAYSAGRVATILPNWTTNPDNTSVYMVLPAARVDVQGWLGNVVTGDGDWAALKAETESILADTITLSNADYGLDALETITSQIKSTIDAPITNFLTSIVDDTSKIHSTLDAPITDLLTSIVDDTSKIHSTLDAPIDSAITQNTTLLSAILSTIDGAGVKPVTAEPAAGAPSATAATGVKIDYLYTIFRNKIETTSGTQKVYDDAGTGVLFSCALSDDATTFTKAEHV